MVPKAGLSLLAICDTHTKGEQVKNRAEFRVSTGVQSRKDNVHVQQSDRMENRKERYAAAAF